MTKVDAWMPLWIGDYLADTMHLSAAEHGAYLLLLMHYWRNGPLPDQDRALSRIVRMTPEEWAESRPTIAAFFAVEGGSWRHGRADAERTKATEGRERLTRRARNAAAARYGKPAAEPGPAAPQRRAEDEDDGPVPFSSNAQAVQEDCPSPSPSPSEEESGGKPPSARRRAGASDQPVVDLPDWLPPDAWADWCAYRVKIGKKTWTQHAAELSVRELGRMRAEGHDPRRVIEQAIRNGWRGLFPLRGGAASSPRANGGAGAWAAAELRRMQGEDPPDDPGEPRFVPSTVIDHEE